MANNKKIPEAWKWVTLEEILQPSDRGVVFSQGWSPQCEKAPSESDATWGVLKTTSIQPGYFLEDQNKRLPESLEAREQLEVKAGDLLITCAGPRNRCGIACLVRKTRKKLMISGKMYRFRVSIDKALPEYIELYLQFHETQKAIDKMKTGISDSGLNLTHSKFKKLLIKLPGINEQKQIVSQIEELFSELDKSIEELKTALQQLKVYRQAVLKWAFEGRLTNECVKDGELIVGWQKLELKKACLIKRGKSKHRPRNDRSLYGGKYPFIQTGDIRNANGGYISTYNQTYSDLGLQQSKLWPRGTLCITIAANIGETAIINFDACFPDSVVGLICNEEILLNKYTNYFFISYKSKLEAMAPATAQKNINVEILEKVLIPICTIEEQHKIVQEIESRFSVCDKIEETITGSLNQSDALRQSILKKAFTGKLI